MRNIEQYEWPENLLIDITEGLTEEVLSTDNLPPDFEATINYLFLNVLPSHGAKIIRKRYQEKMSLGEIASYFGLSKETVRASLKKQLSRLRQPQRLAYLKYGLERANAELKQKIETDPFAVDLCELDLTDQINRMIRSVGVVTVGDLLQLDLKEFKYLKFIGEKNRSRIIQKFEFIGYNYAQGNRVYMSDHKDAEAVSERIVSIAQLNLTPRTYNALRRWGIKSSKDILDLDQEGFVEIRYLGDKGRAETILKLEERGYDCCHLTSNKKSINRF